MSGSEVLSVVSRAARGSPLQVPAPCRGPLSCACRPPISSLPGQRLPLREACPALSLSRVPPFPTKEEKGGERGPPPSPGGLSSVASPVGTASPGPPARPGIPNKAKAVTSDSSAATRRSQRELRNALGRPRRRSLGESSPPLPPDRPRLSDLTPLSHHPAPQLLAPQVTFSTLQAGHQGKHLEMSSLTPSRPPSSTRCFL